MRHATVVGAGPAGLSAAIGLARCDYKVTVLEQRSQWQERVCGAFMNPEAVAHLEWLGVKNEIDRESVTVPDVLVTYENEERIVPVGENGRSALAIPRKQMEQILANRAHADGVVIEMGKHYRDEPIEGVTIFANGRFSGHVPRSPQGEGGWYGWNATFENVGVRPGHMSLNFYRGGYVGTLTFADGRTNICGLVRREDNKPLAWDRVYERALNESPSLTRLMRLSRRAGEWRGVGPLPFARDLKDFGDETIRVGDAGAVGDPFMGEGNGRALGAGPLLHATVSCSGGIDARIYRELWRDAYRVRFEIGYWFRAALARPALFSYIARFLLRRPRLLRRATPYFHTGFLVKARGLS